MGRSKDPQSEKDGAAPKKTKKSSSETKGQDETAAAEHQRKAALEGRIRERVALEARAFDVVNRLIEPGITADFLLQACQFIDHSHYEDVVEERSISRLCGYPLCNNELQQMPKKKYHISTKSNTVYDITVRKKFCSSRCYQASEHLRKQIPQTPVWTRRGAEVEPFELLPHDVSSHAQGEAVIGQKTSGLKDEVLLMEKMDRMERKVTQTQKTRPAKHGQGPVEESQHKSDQLMSLSTEDDLNRGIEKLSLETEDTEESSSGAKSSGSVSNVPGSKSVDSLGLESSITTLTLQDKGDSNCVDSDDDSSENSVSGKGGSSESQKSDRLRDVQDVVSKANTVEPDSDDDDDGVNVSATPRTESDQLCTSQDSGILQISTEVSVSVEGDSETGDSLSEAAREKLSEKPKEDSLKQQPGESKSAYLMRLLDKRRHMLAKVADIQTNLSDPSKRSEPKSNGSACGIDSDSKADSVKSPDSDREENLGDQSKGSTGSSQNSKQVEKNTADTKANQGSGKKKSIHTSKKTGVTASPLSAICQVISTWVSTETVDYLGFNTVQPEAGTGDSSGSSAAFLKDPDMQRKYQDLCQRLAGQERDFDEVLGEEDVEAEGNRWGGKRPLPNYDELRKQAEEYQLQVRQFMAGSMPVKSKPTKPKPDDKGGDADSDRPIVLPDVDSHSQLLIRRRIVLERLDHAMPSLLPPLGLSVQDISAALRELVFTFSLTSHNIVFKPVEWTLAAIILLKMLEHRCEAVRAAFQSPTRSAAFNMVLSRLDHSPASLGQLVRGMLTQRSQESQGAHTQRTH